MRYPLATPLKTRTGDTTKDARLKNAYVEVRGDQSVVKKRPTAQGGVSVGTGTAQGGVGFNIGGTDYFIGFVYDEMFRLGEELSAKGESILFDATFVSRVSETAGCPGRGEESKTFRHTADPVSPGSLPPANLAKKQGEL